MSAPSIKPVGMLACQQQPFLKTLDTHVVYCSESVGQDGLFEVELEDTVIFPEGGGQPSDTGYINGIEVKYARRDGLRCLHYTTALIAAGSAVHVQVDFQRRLDHMQQHSGQHLLSAILEREHGLETVSWSLGPTISHVELKTAKGYVLGADMLAQVEEQCNQAILDNVPVRVEVVDQVEESPESVPADYIGGVIRYVRIGANGQEIDCNACCGTHVAGMAQLQQLKLAGTDRIRGGHTRLFFYVGGRIRQYTQAALQRDKRLAELLSCPPEQHCEAVERTGKQTKAMIKALKTLRRQMAPLAAREMRDTLAATAGGAGVRSAVFHCEEGDASFASGVAGEVVRLMAADGDGPWVAVVAAGAKADGGALVVAGSDAAAIHDAVARLAPLVGECKGGLARGVWQGKAGSFAKLGGFAA